MRFTLYYDGPLSSSANNSRAQEKQNIRQALYPQLLNLWTVHPALPKPLNKSWDEWSSWEWSLPIPYPWKDESYPWRETKAVFPKGSFMFVPLVRRDLNTFCELSILFLRPENPGAILKSGDVDNRILTLSDALCLPTRDQFSSTKIDHKPHDPFFCLLEDDSLITSWTVRTDRLLSSVNTQTIKRAYVRLIIDVRVKISRLTSANMGLLGE